MVETAHERGFRLLEEAVAAIREVKPNDRSEVARRYAIVITMLEKAVAFYHYFIVRDSDG